MLNSCLRIIKGIVFVFVFLFLIQYSTTGISADICGNGICQPLFPLLETCETCPQDCGPCPTPVPTPTPTSIPTPVPTPTPQPDEDSDSIDTGPIHFPSVFLTPLEFGITNKTQLSFSGNTEVEHGVINDVHYSLDNGISWASANPVDGRFDTSFEKFSFTLSFLKEGRYTVTVRAKSLAQIITQAPSYAEVSFTVATSSPEVTLNLIKPNPTRNQTPIFSGNVIPSLASISRVELSLNGGTSWSPASLIGNKFSYSPENKLEDGNYDIIARATDLASNIGFSDSQTLVIDTIPPIIGGNMFALGSQVLTPNPDGSYPAVAGTPLLMGLSTKGGVIKTNAIVGNDTFPLTQISETDLWTGNIVFNSGGKIPLKIIAIDGADNEVTLELNTFFVENFGTVQDKISKNKIANAKVSLFFYDTFSKSWILWDGKPYGQENFQTTNEEGSYSFMVPAGKYYLKVKASGYKTMRSEILTFSESNILNFSFLLSRKPGIKLYLPFIGNFTLPLPYFPFSETLPTPEKTIKKPDLIDNELQSHYLPSFELSNLIGNRITEVHLLGKKTLLTFLSTWSPLSIEQMPILEELGQELESNQSQLAVFLQESQGSIDAYLKRGRYTFSAAIDKDGTGSANYQITTLPTHFFIDSSGIIQEIHVGVLEKSKLLEKIDNLN
ncbi:redoxin domain-containing protein [Candidatus Woesebacteria bacterium]|nr:MAG: redoxin domain-containing protein [Candidatus Woesebacteria bacterium]